MSAKARTEVEGAAQALATRVRQERLTPQNAPAAIRQMLTEHPAIFGSTIAFAPTDAMTKASPYVYRQDGQLVDKDLAANDYDYTRWPWYTEPRDRGEAVWSEPYYDEGGGNVQMTTYSIPVFTDETKGMLLAVVTADVALE